MKKATAWILTVCMALTLTFSGTADRLLTGEPSTAHAASYPKLKTINYTPTGDQQKDIVGFAKTQIGYAEGRNNNTYFGNWFGMNYSPWCAMFVSWCAAKAGVSKSVLPRQGNADRSWAKKQKVYHKSKQWGGNYTPKKGDLIYFSWSVRDWADHIGMVSGTGTENGEKVVYTIEGNKHDKVVKATYDLDNRYILGYASPKYNSDNGSDAVDYTLKYRDGLDETDNDEEDSIIAPTKGTFGKSLTLSTKKFTRKGYKYSSWQVYRENENGQLIYLARDKDTDKKEGWYQKGSIPSDYAKVNVKSGGKLKIRTQVDGTIYVSPNWKKKGLAVKYDANGGVGAPKAQDKTIGKDLTLSKKKPTRSDCEFLGWAKKAGSSQVDYKPGGVYKTDKAVTLHAVWKRVTTPFKVKVTLASGVNIRTGPGLSYDIADRADRGKTLTIHKVKNGWGKIKGTKNWVMLKYTKVTKGYRVKVSTKYLNLRTGPGTSYSIKGKIAPGTYDISKISGTWGKVKANGYWISLDYARRVK